MIKFTETILGALVVNAGGQMLANSIEYIGIKLVNFIKEGFKSSQNRLSDEQINQIIEIISQEKVKHPDNLKRDFVYNLDDLFSEDNLLIIFDELEKFITDNAPSIKKIVGTESMYVNQQVENNYAGRDINVAGRDNIIINK